jgi:hypothetical protein
VRVGLQSFEHGVERMVEGVFARAFKTSVRPLELGKRLVREMDDHRSLDVRGRTIVPNDFTFYLSANDAAGFSEIHDALVRELADAAREYARDEGYFFMGPVSVALLADPRLKPGRFGLESRMVELAGGRGAGALVTPDGQRHPLGEGVSLIGRLPECLVVLSDPNASRRHCEVRAVGSGYVITDLNSTNGTTVNGARIGADHPLGDGDVIGVGATRIRFEAS